MNQPSLSMLIEALQAQPGREKYEHVLSVFSQSSVGVVVVGAPEGHPGGTLKADGERISLGSSQHGDGKSRILAFADPKEFSANFGPRFNGEMRGEDVFKVALHNQTCSGILLNSAKAPISLPMERVDIQRFLQAVPPGQDGPAKRPWWKRWKR